MATPAQITANRANAQHSTGAKTDAGKARVAQNRTTHGLAGCSVLLPGEDPAAFQSLYAKLTLELVPGNTSESFLVRQVAQCQWKLVRVSKWESEIITEGLEGDPGNPSRLVRLFSKSGDAAEALEKLHRYENQLVRALIAAKKELRLSKSARHKASTTEAATTLIDIDNLRAALRAALSDAGLGCPAAPAVDDSNPISPPNPAGDIEKEAKVHDAIA
jgi:hypothetical protein